MNMRIQRIRPTVNAVQTALQNAYRLGQVRVVRRIRVLLEDGHEPLDGVYPAGGSHHGLSMALLFAR